MAYPSNLIRLTWVFDLQTGGTIEDLAEFAINCGEDSFEPDDAQLLKLARGAFNAWESNVATSRFGTNVHLGSIIAQTFNGDGSTALKQTLVAPSDWRGTAGGACMPWETSLALSLYTYPRGSFVAHGRRKRGRIYLPPMSASVLDPANSGYFKDSDIDAFLGELTSFIEDVGNDDLGVHVVTPQVFSRVDSVMRSVTQISIDAKFDSQRRREKGQHAGYRTANVSF
jgi:hypothetical protein